MAQWATFVGLSLVVLLLLLVLSHLSQQVLVADDRGGAGSPSSNIDRPDRTSGAEGLNFDPIESVEPDTKPSDGNVSDRPTRQSDDADPWDRDASFEGNALGPDEETTVAVRATTAVHDPLDFSPGVLLANVALSQGLFAGVLVAGAWYTQIPPAALGLRGGLGVPTAVAVGLGLGIALYAADEVGAAFAGELGFEHSEELRGLLAPETASGWLVLLVGVLPLIAVFEEFLFRAALIGVIAAGFGISPWLLAIGSSVAFALGHGIQGPAGIVVTGLLGFVLAAVFVFTGSLLVVVVAHYVVNALEFVVHEGLGVEWTAALAG